LRQEEWSLHEECLRAGRAALDRFTALERPATLSEIARILELASKLGRLASGLATDHTEVSAEDSAFTVQVDVALEKIYGAPLPGELPAEGHHSPPAIVEVEAKRIADVK